MAPDASAMPKVQSSPCTAMKFVNIDRSDIDRSARYFRTGCSFAHIYVWRRLEGRLFNFDEAPPWTKDNDKILSGYRRAAAALCSFLLCHLVGFADCRLFARFCFPQAFALLIVVLAGPAVRCGTVLRAASSCTTRA